MEIRITATPKEVADIVKVMQEKSQKQNPYINVGDVPPVYEIEKLLKEMFTNPTCGE